MILIRFHLNNFGVRLRYTAPRFVVQDKLGSVPANAFFVLQAENISCVFGCLR